MSSGGGKSTTTVQNSGPPAWAVPSFQNMIWQANQVANQPYQAYNGQRVAGFTPDQQLAQNMIRQQATWPGGIDNTSMNFATGLLSGKGGFDVQANPYTGKTTSVGTNKYAGSNPYLGQMIQAAQGDVTRNYTNSIAPNLMAQFNAGGAYGGTAHQAALAESQRQLAGELGDISTNLRGADYQNQQQLAEADINRRLQAQQTDLARNAGLADAQLGREQQAWSDLQGRQLQALGMAPSLQQMGYMDAQQLGSIGQQQQMLKQLGLDTSYGDFVEERDWDANRLGVLANALGTVQGGSQTSTGANPNYRSAGQNALSAAALIGGMMLMASSKDMKETHGSLLPSDALKAIKKMPVDRWNYKGDSTPHVGTYAEDFNSALGLPNQPYISVVDAVGVLTGAVQELDKKISRKGGK